MQNNSEETFTAFGFCTVQGEPRLAVVQICGDHIESVQYKRLEDSRPLEEIIKTAQERL